MSNRYNNQGQRRNEGNRRVYKPIANQTLLSSRQSDATSSSVACDASLATGRIKMGDDGEWVSNTGMPSGNFVNYLPQDEAVASGLGADEGGLDPLESQRVVDLLNRELSRLLKLKPRDFWKEVASDTSLHAFLESFLKYRSRWYDFPYRGAKGIVAGVIVGEFDLCRRVFLLLYRISSNRDPGARNADSLSSKDHEALLQEKKLLDLPKLLDICAIYAHENEDLTRLSVLNSIKAQPWMHDEFIAVISHFLSVIHTMHERCNSSLEVLFSSGHLQDQGISRLRSDYLEVMDFINDAVVTVDAFIGAYKPAAIFFSCPVDMSYGNVELLTTLARLHDSLLPSLRKGLHIVFASGEDTLQEAPSEIFPDISISLKLLSTRIVNLAWKLLYLCYLSDEAFETGCPFPASMKVFPANVGDPMIRADILLQTVREISQEYSHSHEVHQKGTFLQDIEKNHKMMSRVGLLRNAGWISMDDEQFQFLLSILGRPVEANNINETPQTAFPGTSNIRQVDEDTAILESKISQIKDLFPEYGKGFLAVCLEAYNQNPEEVIQRILENTLHEDLQSLDISLEEIPPRKSVSSVSMLDKGKGKLVESPLPSSTNSISYPPEGPSSSSLSSVGRYTRKAVTDVPHYDALDSRDEKHTSKTVALIAQLEYEDEYDDSFDDLGLSVGDSWLEETQDDKVTSDPGKVDNSKSSTSNMTSKWNSRKKPQYYVKDGKNYGYKVEGSVAAANYNEASLLNQSQRETIYGLGRGGNIPLGAVKRLTESNDEDYEEHNNSEVEALAGRGHFRGKGRRGGEPGKGNFRGRGRRGGESENDEVEGQAGGGRGRRGGEPGQGNFRGRGRRGGESENDEVEGQAGGGNVRGRGRRGGGRNNYRKDQALKKHLSGLRG